MDLYLFQKINYFAGQYAVLDWLGIFCVKYLPYILAALIIAAFWRKYRVILAAFASGFLARFVFTEVIRWLWFHPRPFIIHNVNQLIGHDSSSSFPSGHAAFFFAASVVVYHYNKKAGVFFLTASFFLSMARIFVGVHWPVDVLAGAIVGAISGWLVIKISKKLHCGAEGGT